MALVVIVGVNGDQMAHEQIDWDQASLLVQFGLPNPTGLTVAPSATRRLLACTGKG